MNVEIAPDRGEVKVTVIDAGLDISHTYIGARAKFEVPSKTSVLYIEPIEMGADVSADPHQLSLDF